MTLRSSFRSVLNESFASTYTIFNFFLPNIALISVFCLTDGTARIFHDCSLLFTPGMSHLMVKEYPSVRERERGRERESAHGGRRRRQ